MTSASAKDDQAVMRPMASMKSSIPWANRSADSTSALQNLAVIDAFAHGRPLRILIQIGHVGVVHLLGHGIAADGFGQNLLRALAQSVHHIIRQRGCDD